jgi:SAM-dependent methyltransferase
VSEERFSDWVRAPNIGRYPDLYERENEAIARDGRLDQALEELADWSDKTFLDVGTGTGFWLPVYAACARRVIGVEPDPVLRERAVDRVDEIEHVSVLAGSAEQLPVEDGSVDVAHARFAYFFGLGAEKGLDEIRRVLRPGGSFIAIDNSWTGGAFATLLELATEGNAAIDPEATALWWEEQGADRTEVEAAWVCRSPRELESILRIEFADEVVDEFLNEHHDGTNRLTYRYALYSLVAD